MIATVIHVYMELVRMKLTDLLVYVEVDMKETHVPSVSFTNQLSSSAVSIQFISRILKSNILNIEIFLWWNRFRFRFLGMRA